METPSINERFWFKATATFQERSLVPFGEAVDGWKTPFVHTSSQQKSRSKNNYSIAGLSKTKSHPIVSNSVFYICLYYSWYHGRNIMDNSPTVCSISYHVSGAKQRAGLRVCPERNEWRLIRRLISLRRRSVLWLWYIFGFPVPRQFFGKICRKSELSADFMRVGLFPFFTFFGELEIWWLIVPWGRGFNNLYKPKMKPQ